MRRWAMGGLVLAALGLSAASGQASWEPPPRPKPPVVGAVPPPQPSLFQRMFGVKSKQSAQAKTTYDPSPRQATPANRPATGPVEEPSGGFDKEQRTYLRRLAVCDKLREIARETNDDELQRKADQLEQRAWSHCQQRTGQVLADSEPVDERILERHLGPPAGQTPGLSTKADRLYTVPGNRSGQGLAREDMP